MPTIDVQLCSGCGRCVAACPLHLITLEVSGFRKNAVIKSPEKCTLCRQCADACPVAAIILNMTGEREGNTTA